jgi:hypothetical protein
MNAEMSPAMLRSIRFSGVLIVTPVLLLGRRNSG